MQIQPSEFWRMRPRDFWALFAVSNPGKTTKSTLTNSDAKRLRKMMDAANAARA
jgi:hypothetical protein